MVVYRAEMPTPKIGEFDSELVQDFWLSLADQLGCNLHVLLHHGRNSHHIAEAIFKGAARALRQAVERDPRQIGIPSTKGTLV
jgi:imidazoleglycerol-phosphate dehydratase